MPSIHATQEPIENRLYLSVDETANLAGVTVDTVLAWIKTKSLIAADVSRSRSKRPRWRIDRRDLDAFMQARKTITPVPIARRRSRITPAKSFV